MKRDVWTSSFKDILFALDFPELVDKPPVVPDPDRLPGAFVHIPDTNLRAVIAEELDKSPNAPITVEEMEGLRSLDARSKGLRDLTGLQFAINLSWLHLRDNSVSDLSPVQGLKNLAHLYIEDTTVSDISPVQSLTQLIELEFDGTSVSDISPVENLTNLTRLNFGFTMVSDISPVKSLKNLAYLYIDGTSVSDISPVQSLTQLIELEFDETLVSDISPVENLTNLTRLSFASTLVSDISPIRNLKSLTSLGFRKTLVPDLSPLAGLINLEDLDFYGNNISDLSPFAGLINLKHLTVWRDTISDLSPLAGLTKLEIVAICCGEISDLAPLANLTELKELYLVEGEISDISPLAGLTGLTRLNLESNKISDVSPLAGLTNLEWLNIAKNRISDLSPLERLRENIKLVWHDNPVFPADAPKIEGPWLWVVLPAPMDDRLSDTDLLSEVSGGAVTETEIATHGATVGKSVGDSVWTSHKLPPTGYHNIEDMLKREIRYGTVYGSVSLYSPREQQTTMYVGGSRGVRVWFNGTLIYERLRGLGGGDYTDFFPVTLQQGRNVLLVAVHTEGNGFFGFEPGTDYIVSMGVGYALSQTPIHAGDSFTLDIRAENVSDMAGWQFDIAFDPAVLEAIDVSEGDFLKSDGGTAFFQSGSIDNAAGKIIGLSSARLSAQGVNGIGTLLQVRFKAKSVGETQLALGKFQFGSATGNSIPAGPQEIRIVVEERLTTGDVNRDGIVSILDLILVAQQLGKRVPAGSAVDVNGDGIVSILDLIRVSQGIAESPAAPSTPPLVLASRPVGAGEKGGVDTAMIKSWIAQARLEDDGSLAFKQGIENLEALLRSLIPEETALLANYPNPFNPETWIPYQLAESAEVTLTIYDMNGQLVRRLAVGHQAAGMYQSRNRAAYWDGRNQLGESVASGLYFYTLTTDEFTATRRMLILK